LSYSLTSSCSQVTKLRYGRILPLPDKPITPKPLPLTQGWYRTNPESRHSDSAPVGEAASMHQADLDAIYTARAEWCVPRCPSGTHQSGGSAGTLPPSSSHLSANGRN